MNEQTIEEQFIQLQDSMRLIRSVVDTLEELDNIPKKYEGDWKFISGLLKVKSILESLGGIAEASSDNDRTLETLVKVGKAKLETVWEDYKQAIRQGRIQ